MKQHLETLAKLAEQTLVPKTKVQDVLLDMLGDSLRDGNAAFTDAVNAELAAMTKWSKLLSGEQVTELAASLELATIAAPQAVQA